MEQTRQRYQWIETVSLRPSESFWVRLKFWNSITKFHSVWFKLAVFMRNFRFKNSRTSTLTWIAQRIHVYVCYRLNIESWIEFVALALNLSFESFHWKIKNILEMSGLEQIIFSLVWWIVFQICPDRGCFLFI